MYEILFNIFCFIFFHGAKLGIFLQSGYLVCFASFLFRKKRTILTKNHTFSVSYVDFS